MVNGSVGDQFDQIEFEHDADILRKRGRPAPDIDLLREKLRAPASAWL